MAFAYTTRRGKTYYLHTGPKRGGGIQHYVSTDPKGPVADAIPEGFEIYETPNGQVYLRKKKPARIQPDELALVERELQNHQTSEHRYLAEISDEKIIIHEGDTTYRCFAGNQHAVFGARAGGVCGPQCQLYAGDEVCAAG